MPKNKKKKSKPKHNQPEQDDSNIPKTLVFSRGKVGSKLTTLVLDMRKVMLPFTAPKLKERRSNTLKDFIQVSGQLGVTHFLSFNTTDISSYFKISKTPVGPTISFRILQYSLSSDVKHLQAHPHSGEAEFKTPPLVVLNGFSNTSERHIELARTTFREMFPKLNVDQLANKSCRRVVLIQYDAESDTFEWRHYIIMKTEIGMNKSIKRVLQQRVTDLSKYEDISDYVLSGLGEAESDLEDESTHVQQDFVKKATQYKPEKTIKKKSKISLIEMGPRMTLQLFKIQEKLLDGKVRYNRHVTREDADEKSLSSGDDDEVLGEDDGSFSSEEGDDGASFSDEDQEMGSEGSEGDSQEGNEEYGSEDDESSGSGSEDDESSGSDSGEDAPEPPKGKKQTTHKIPIQTKQTTHKIQIKTDEKKQPQGKLKKSDVSPNKRGRQQGPNDKKPNKKQKTG